MRSEIYVIICMFASIGFFCLFVISNSLLEREGKYYDCSIAEISPDFTPAMKQECREMRRRTAV